MVAYLEDIKRHLEVDFDSNDELITSLIKAVEASVEKSIGAPLHTTVVDGSIPDDILQVIRIMVAERYHNREGQSANKMTAVPFALAHFLAPYVKLT